MIGQNNLGSDARPEPWVAPALVSITVAALLIRLDGFISGSLDGQELFNRRAVAGSVAHMLGAVHHDLLYYAILKVTAVFTGLGVGGLRLPSLVFGTATVILTFTVGKNVLGRPRVALFAAGLVALSFQQVTKSQTARSYSFYGCLVLVMMLILWRGMQRPGHARLWLAFAASVVMLTFSHITGWLYVGATLPAVLVCSNRRVLRSWGASLLAAGTVFAVWVVMLTPHVLMEVESVVRAHRPGLDSVRRLLESYASLNGLPDFRHATVATLSIAVLLFVVVGAHAIRRPPLALTEPVRRVAIALIAGVALLPPILLVFLTSFPLGVEWEFHHVFPSQAPFALLTSLGVALLFSSRRAAVRVLAAVVAPLLLLAQVVPIAQARPAARKVPFSQIAQYLGRRVEPEPNIYATSWYHIGAPVNFYLRAAGLRLDSVVVLPAAPPPGSSLWLLYRPESVQDSAVVAKLIRHGWRSVRAITFSRVPIDKMGVRLLHLRTPAGEQPASLGSDPRTPRPTGQPAKTLAGGYHRTMLNPHSGLSLSPSMR